MIQLQNIYKFYPVNGMRRVVLDHVSINLESGFSYAILGVNGAGKSTLMRILAGAELPNSGTIRRSVRVSWPLGFSGGLHRSMSARENAQFVARAYGEDVRRVVEFVEDFAEIGPYFDAPVGTYSSGMVQRVAFGLSMAIDFECYLIDEVMAVGDGRFRERSRQEFRKRKSRSDIILTSHSMSSIREYCQRGIVLARGQITYFEDVEGAIAMYNRLNL
jgi:capsular polysaccharide transport system ATP-binding protein